LIRSVPGDWVKGVKNRRRRRHRAQAGYQFAVSGTDGGRRDGVRGDLGVHYAW